LLHREFVQHGDNKVRLQGEKEGIRGNAFVEVSYNTTIAQGTLQIELRRLYIYSMIILQ
jgi:hypothetical protein